MVAMEQGYSKTHPDINLSSVTLAWGNPYYTKLSLATLGDQPPDVDVRLKRKPTNEELEQLNRVVNQALAEMRENYRKAGYAR